MAASELHRQHPIEHPQGTPPLSEVRQLVGHHR
jgi:hypothetical protein